MAKYYVSTKKDNETGNVYYFITFKDNNKEIDIVDNIADELNMPVEDFLDICEENGAIEVSSLTDCKDLFTNKSQAQYALQEILEFALEDNQCNCEEDYSDLIPVFPDEFSSYDEEISDEEINEMIKLCICNLEENEETDNIELSKDNTLILVNKNRMCDDPACEEYDKYYYTIKVCEDVYEYSGYPDCN